MEVSGFLGNVSAMSRGGSGWVLEDGNESCWDKQNPILWQGVSCHIVKDYSVGIGVT